MPKTSDKIVKSLQSKFAVCLSFDFDALSSHITTGRQMFPGGISRGERGPHAIPRILRLLDKYHAPATFFVPGHTALAYPRATQMIFNAGHEIGHHGWVHEHPALLLDGPTPVPRPSGTQAITDSGQDIPEPSELEVLNKGIESLHQVLPDAVVRGYRSPAWDTSHETVQLLQKMGFHYDSSFMGDYFEPYYLRTGDKFDTKTPFQFGQTTSLPTLPVNWTYDDFPNFEFIYGFSTAIKSPSNVEEIWKAAFDRGMDEQEVGSFNLTLHPQTIGQPHLMAMFERLIQHMVARNARFMTMYDYLKSWRDKNPVELWMQRDDHFHHGNDKGILYKNDKKETDPASKDFKGKKDDGVKAIKL